MLHRYSSGLLSREVDLQTWRELMDAAERTLAASGVETPESDAGFIVAEVAGSPRSELAAACDQPATALATARVETLTARRATGEPLQYVLGSWSFCGIDLFVDPRVLIPRPETEVTAQVAIAEATKIGARRGRGGLRQGHVPDVVVADLGTGSGAIALALAAELPDIAVWATDVSTDALAVARANLTGSGIGAGRVHLAQGDWFDALPAELAGRLGVIVANPPYVAAHEVAELPFEVARYEPRDALVAGPTGLECLERIVADAPRWLVPSGALVCELAPHQAMRATELAHGAGFVSTHVEHDLAGRDRVLVARRS